MSPQDGTANQVITDLIKKQMTIFGPSITLAQVQNIKGIEVDQEGIVVNIADNPEFITKELLAAWESLSPFLAKTIAHPALKRLNPQNNNKEL